MRKLQTENAEVMHLAIQQEIERSDESRYDHRLHGVLLVASGPSCGDVAHLFAEDARTIQRWIRRFEQRGFEGLREGERPGRPRSLDEKKWKAPARDLRRNPREFGLEQNLWDGKILGEHLRVRYGMTLGGAAVPEGLWSTGFSSAQTAPAGGAIRPSEGRGSKKLRRLARRKDIELWSLDECHFQQHGSRLRMWIPPEIKDPILQHAPTRKSVACFGAVSLSAGKFVRAMCNVFNAETFKDFLKKLLRHHPRGKRVVVVLDNARYHHAVLLAPLLRRYRGVLRLLFLPPYSPQLAPIERVWKLARRIATHNRHFATLAEVLDAIETCFDRWRKSNPALRRLCGII